MKKSIGVLASMMLAMGAMGGMPMPRMREPYNPDRYDPTEPVTVIKNVPKGCRKESVSLDLERGNEIYTINGEIIYGTLKARNKAIIK